MVLLLLLVFSLLIVIYVINFSKINTYLKNTYYSFITKEISNTKDDSLIDAKHMESDEVDLSQNFEGQQPSIPLNNNDKGTNEEGIDELVHKVILNDDNEVSVYYIRDQDSVRFIGISPENGNQYSFSISPSKDKILLEDNVTQDAYMVDASFNLFKLDPEFFYSNSARIRFYKSDIIARYQGYKWYKDARFLDDNTIIYVSNLPWFGGSDEYIWKTDLSDINNIKHFMTSIGGQNIELGELTEEGVRVIINNEMKLLTFSFVLI